MSFPRERHFTHPTVTAHIGPVLCGAKRRGYNFGDFLKQTKDRARVTCRRCVRKLARLPVLCPHCGHHYAPTDLAPEAHTCSTHHQEA